MIKYDDKANTIIEVQSLPEQEFLQIVEQKQESTSLLYTPDHSGGSAN